MVRNLLINLSLSIGFVLFGAGARADGPVIITQASAEAGGVTPGDAPGFPVTITIPGTFQLGSAIQLTSGVGFDVLAGNVTLDLAGQEIDGLSQATIGIRGRALRLVVKNGNVQRFRQNGIQFAPAASAPNRAYWTIDHVAVFGNGRAGIICGGACSVLNSTVSDNGFGNTTAAVHPGILIDTGVIIGSVISGNSSFGIEATQCAAHGHDFLLGNNAVNSGPPVNFNVFDLTPNFAVDNCPVPAKSPN